MNRILNKKILRFLPLLLCFLVASQICLASGEVPLLPMTVQGTALVDGSPAPRGTIIAAYLNGVQAGKFQVGSSTGEYCFWISGTTVDEGKPVSFTVGGRDSGKILAWKPGQQVLSLQLAVGKEVNSNDYVKSLTSTIGFESLTNIEKQKASGKSLETRVIESSVPVPDVDAIKSIDTGSLGKGIANPVEDLIKLKRAPGFTVVCTVAGLIVFIFGFNLARKRKK